MSFLADELVPFVQATYGTDPDSARTGTLGASLGGVAALYAAISRPDVFKLAAGQSGAYSVNSDALVRQLQAQRQEDLQAGDLSGGQTRIYLVVGTYETAVAINGDSGDLLAANRRLEESLSELGITHQLDERPEGHSWGLWQGTLGRALDYLLNP
jgi:enterochelin esterase family protein